MKNFFHIDKKYRNIAWLIVFCVFIILIAYEVITNFTHIYDKISLFYFSATKTLAPVIFGGIIAYLLYKPCSSCYAFLRAKIKYFNKKHRFAKIVSVLLVNLLALILIALLLYTIIPNTVESITQIASRSSEIVEPIQRFIIELSDNELVIEALKLFNIDINNLTSSEGLGSMLSAAQKILDSVGTYMVGFVVDLGTFLYNFIFGFVIAVYINIESEELINQMRKFAKALFGGFYDKSVEIARYSDRMFFGYLTGKFLSSAIIGIIAYILCLLLGVKYALLTGVILCFTNLIPIFGPWLGAVPCILFALMSGIKYAIIVLIIVLAMQQLDNNVIGPKIIGDRVNLNGFWILVSIIVCGKLWGLMGMVIAIPLFAVLKKVVSEIIEKRLANIEKKKQMPPEEAGL